MDDCIVLYLDYPSIKNTYVNLLEEVTEYKNDLLEVNKTFIELNYLHDISILDMKFL